MAWFRRKASGKHALGAAVTSIPSRPLAVTLPPSVTPAPPPIAPPAAAKDLYGSIVELIATGEAWVEPGSPPAPPTADPPQVTVAASARSSLELALAPLLPVQAGAAAGGPVPEAQPLRVQLGFRDGTSTTLDPASTQAQALEQLAQSLTRRD